MSGRWISRTELVLLTIFFAWLAWLPLPFGSIIEKARAPLIAVPLALLAVAAAVRLAGTIDRDSTARPTLPWLIWGGGAVLLCVAGLIQLLPLPGGIVRMLSPESHRIWSAARSIAAIAGLDQPAFRLTVDPAATSVEVFRIAALFASFTLAAMLVRTAARRVTMAIVLCLAGVFEALYGLREAALQRYEIWGWVNRLIFDRVTGTFVNPNHFGHYLAIIVPVALFLVSLQWHYSSSPRTPTLQRLVAVFEQRALRAGVALLVVAVLAAGLLLSQSRGALLSLAAGLLAGVALSPGRRMMRIGATAVAGLVLLVLLVVFLGPERTVNRFVPSAGEAETLVGRRIGIAAAMGVWQRFPLTGSGLGTFPRVVSMEQDAAVEAVFHRAHNDYAEMLATAGGAGGGIAIVSLLAGYVVLCRRTVGKESAELTFRRTAWQTAALASLTVAMVHALFDFNFFIPSNPATLAAIVGAAVASIDHDRRTRR